MQNKYILFMKYPFSTPELKERRRELRNNATSAEKRLWQFLRKSQLGYKFTRQHSVDCFILDFYCPSKKVAIELDGRHHAEEKKREYDKDRTFIIESHEIRVLRFWNWEIEKSIDHVCKRILKELKRNPPSEQKRRSMKN